MAALTPGTASIVLTVAFIAPHGSTYRLKRGEDVTDTLQPCL